LLDQLLLLGALEPLQMFNGDIQPRETFVRFENLPERRQL